MRFNSLRVEQGVDHLIAPLDGAMPVNLKDMNLKQLKALTSILTDLSKVSSFEHSRFIIIGSYETLFQSPHRKPVLMRRRKRNM